MEERKSTEKDIKNGAPIAAWIVVLFLLTFLCALPVIIGGVSMPNLSPSAPLFPFSFAGILLSAYTPLAAALLVARFFPGGGGAGALLRQIRTWRTRMGWYALALIGPAVLFLLANVTLLMLGGAAPEGWLRFPSLSNPGPGGFAFFIGQLLAGSFGEEPGWRGFALPRLQAKYGALWASILIGIVWSSWHLWPIITPHGFSLTNVTDAAATYMRLISTSIVYAWMYNSTKGSLFLVMVAHAGHNIAAALIQTPSSGVHSHLIIALFYLGTAIAVTVMTKARLSIASPA
jgi:CAAX protease family protein